MAKKSKEEWKTYKNVFDNFTLLNLFKLSSQGYFEELKGPISMGKEANVFSAVTKENKLVAVKIYRLETCDFNKMYDYIKFDPRYVNLKKQRRQVIFAWSQREFRNLMKAREAGVRVPTPITFNHNILVLEFIGSNDAAARKLKDDVPENIKGFMNKTLEYMKKLNKAGLVHGDLSSYNILNLNGAPVFIDFSTATPSNAPNYKEYLERDVKNICSFFRKQGVKCEEEEIKKKITK